MGTQVVFEDQTAFVFVVPWAIYLLIHDVDGDAVRIRRVWSGRRSRPPFLARSQLASAQVKLQQLTEPVEESTGRHAHEVAREG